MGKLTVIIDDSLERELRNYIAHKYPERPYGKLTQVIEEALRDFLKKSKGKVA